MKYKKEIRIGDPHLQSIRNNLREVLWLEWDKRGLNIKKAQLHMLDSELSQEEKLALHDSLESEYKLNKRLIKPSIIMCGWCHQRNKDAIFNPSNRQWFCPDCYQEHFERITSSTSFIY